MTDIRNTITSHDLMTRALQQLEKHDYHNARITASQLLDVSDSIEQRLAAIEIGELAIQRNDSITDTVLTVIYTY